MAKDIKVLEGLEAVRKRPAMFIGDLGENGFHHLIWEVLDNCIDEAMAGYCTNIEMVLEPAGWVSVTDNGRGIPVDMHEQEKVSALQVVLTKLHAGGKFNDQTYKISGGLHGVGISCVNALSERLEVKVFKEGKIYQQHYSRGDPLDQVKVVGQTDKMGTEIRFRADTQLFQVREFNIPRIQGRLRELAYLNSGVKLVFSDKRQDDPEKNPQTLTYHSEGGLVEFVSHLDKSRASLIPLPIGASATKDDIIVDIAINYNTSYDETILSYVNNIKTLGGVHLEAFRRGLKKAIKGYGDRGKIFEKEKIEMSTEDLREGLTCVLSLKVPEPLFEGQTKARLGNPEVAAPVSDCVNEALTDYLEENPAEAKIVMSKVIEAGKARMAARKAREAVQRKSVLSGGGLPGKLADCSQKDPAVCRALPRGRRFGRRLCQARKGQEVPGHPPPEGKDLEYRKGTRA